MSPFPVTALEYTSTEYWVTLTIARATITTYTTQINLRQTPTTTPTSVPSSSSSSLSSADIGAIVGSIIGFIILVALLYYCCRTPEEPEEFYPRRHPEPHNVPPHYAPQNDHNPQNYSAENQRSMAIPIFGEVTRTTVEDWAQSRPRLRHERPNMFVRTSQGEVLFLGRDSTLRTVRGEML